MANAVGMIGRSCSWVQLKNNNSREKVMREKNRARVCSVSASATTVNDPYKTLRIDRGATKSDVKKAFRQLALQYHPDVCRGNNNGVQFHHINEAYDIVMGQLRGESTKPEVETYEPYDAGIDEPMMGMNDPDWDLWEEWMGWEGAGIRDYSTHINPYL